METKQQTEQIKELTIDTNLNIYDYVSTIDELVNEYYDEEGNYVPHYGELNTMRLFYNLYVKDDIAGISHDITEATQLEPIITNKAFLSAYRNGLLTASDGNPLTFASAAAKANEIVFVRNNSFGSVVSAIKWAVKDIEEKLGMASSETINDIIAAADKLSDAMIESGIDSNSIVEAVGTSKNIQNIVGGGSATVS